MVASTSFASLDEFEHEVITIERTSAEKRTE